MKIVYNEKSITFQKNIMPAGWHPLYDTVLEAFSLDEIPSDIMNQFSDDTQEMIMWFFLDLEGESNA